MPWKPLERENLPTLLCGPIVRDIQNYADDGASVSVWFVLKQYVACQLIVAKNNSVETFLIKSQDVTSISKVEDDNQCIEVGPHLYAYLLTAKAKNKNVKFTNEIYTYQIILQSTTGLKDTDYKKVGQLYELNLDNVTFKDNSPPSFTFPSDKIEKLNIFHGSCRKPHGGDGQADALALLADPIKKNLNDKENRPQLLFLTGDQIYADDVANVLLYMIRKYIQILFDKELTAHDIQFTKEQITTSGNPMNPNRRNQDGFLQNLTGFTGMIGLDLKYGELHNKENCTKSHLLSFEEYFIMYLMVWSDVLWSNFNTCIPLDRIKENEHITLTFLEKFKNTKENSTEWFFLEDKYRNEVPGLISFYNSLSSVRKVLANIPTYMMFDDHDVTDDWNLNYKWTENVSASKLGTAVIGHALKAYMICQHWGNKPGVQISNNNIPILEYYGFEKSFSNFEVISLDLRTNRSWPKNADGNTDPYGYAGLLSDNAISNRLSKSFSKKYAFIISGTPLIGVPKAEMAQKAISELSAVYGRYDVDAESWALNNHSFNLFLSAISKNSRKNETKIIVLSGDVHYSFAAKYILTSNKPLYGEKEFEMISQNDNSATAVEANCIKINEIPNYVSNNHKIISGSNGVLIDTKSMIIQLCSSSLMNHEIGTTKSSGIHRSGYNFVGMNKEELLHYLSAISLAAPKIVLLPLVPLATGVFIVLELSNTTNISNLVNSIFKEYVKHNFELKQFYSMVYLPNEIKVKFKDIHDYVLIGGRMTPIIPGTDITISYKGFQKLHHLSPIIAKAPYCWNHSVEYIVEKRKASGKEIVGHNNISQVKFTSDGKSIQQITHWIKDKDALDINTDGDITLESNNTTFTIPLDFESS